MAAPTFVGAGAMDANSSGTAIQAALPAGVQADDLMVFIASSNENAMDYSMSDGWTAFGPRIQEGGASARAFWKIHDGSEGNPTCTTSASMSSTNGGFGRVYAFRGTDLTTPFEDYTGLPGFTTTPDSSAIDTTDVERLAVVLAAIDDNGTITNFPPSTWTAAGTAAQSSTSEDHSQLGIYKVIATAQTVAAVDVCTHSQTDPWITFSFALVPPASGGAVVEGAASLALTFGATVSGSRRANAAASMALSLTRTVSSKVGRKAAASLPLSLTTTTSGVRKAYGAAAQALTLAVTTVGKRTAKGAASLPLTLTITTSGITGAVRGAASMAMTFGATVAGRRRAKSSAALPLTFGVTTSGTRRARAAAALALTLQATTSGRRRANAAVSTALTLAITTAGFVGQVASATPTVQTGIRLLGAGRRGIRATLGRRGVTPAGGSNEAGQVDGRRDIEPSGGSSGVDL